MRKTIIMLSSGAALLTAMPASAEVLRGTNENGQHWTVTLLKDGVAKGVSTPLYGTALMRDTGHWWRQGKDVCVRWQHWRNGGVRCLDGHGHSYTP
jgi:hypothetical protein